MLNVLPVEYKTALAQALLYRQVRVLSLVIIVAGALVSGLLFGTEWFLQRWQARLPLNDGLAQITPEERQLLEDLITTLQLTSSAVQTTAAAFHNPLTAVAQVLTNTPDAVQLNSLTIDYTNNAVRLTGLASDRETLVSYQQQVSSAPFLEAVTFPLSNLELKDQIPFSMTAKLHHDETQVQL